MPLYEVHKADTNITKPASIYGINQGFEFSGPAGLGQDGGQRMEGALGMRKIRNCFEGVNQGQGRVCRRRRPQRMSDNERVEKAAV